MHKGRFVLMFRITLEVPDWLCFVKSLLMVWGLCRLLLVALWVVVACFVLGVT